MVTKYNRFSWHRTWDDKFQNFDNVALLHTPHYNALHGTVLSIQMLNSKYTDTHVSATKTLPNQFLLLQHMGPTQQERKRGQQLQSA
jgi:hypothetical protein